MQTLAAGSQAAGFEVLSTRELPEFRARAVRCRHLATALEVFHLAVDDPENLFAFAFRTPPPDDSGVAHILEHSVLCGSRRYPVKDPFVVLLKSSLQTFLNAFTFPDKTVYPASSMLEKDFFNLLAVYGDAVFFPNLPAEVFQQEGHHLELAPDGSLKRVGVVYNEMKGVFSSAEAIVGEQSVRSLFPDVPYGFESGGHPRRIPSLTHEGLVSFHQRAYHPSNCRLFLYGNIPTERTLAFLQENFLAGFSGGPEMPAIPTQPRWSSPRFTEAVYPVQGEGEEGSKSTVTLNWLTAPATDPGELLAMEVLTEILIGNAGSPLSKALLESELGHDLSSATGLDTELAETAFCVGLRGCDAGRVREVEETVLGTLRSLAGEGIPAELVSAALHRVEFRNREIVRGGRPFSLSLMRRSLRGWLHDRDPELTLEFRPRMDELRRRLEAGGFFESLIRRHLLDNPHRSTVLVRPDPEEAGRREREEREELQAIAGRLTPAERRGLEEDNRRLALFQQTPDRPEDLARLPALRRGDLPSKVDLIPTSDRLQRFVPGALLHELHTNGIVYLDLAVDAGGLPEQASSGLALLGRAVTGCGLPDLSWHQTSNRLSLLTGGFGASLGADTPAGGGHPAQLLIFRVKMLEENFEAGLELAARLFTEADFRDLKRLEMLLLEMRNDLKASLVPAGSYFAALRAGARLSEAVAAEERWKGVAQLLWLTGRTERPDRGLAETAGELERLRSELFVQRRLTLNLTCDGAFAERAGRTLERFWSSLPEGSARGGGALQPLDRGAGLEALVTATNVNYAAVVVPASPFGTLESVQEAVLAHYLSTGFLWEKVRMQGGAYGAGASVSSLERLFTFSSYRDPQIDRTLAVFREGLREAGARELEPGVFEQVLIGAVGKEDRPMAPGEKGFMAYKRAALGITDSLRQLRRDRLLAAGPADLSAAAIRLEQAYDRGFTAVVSGRQALEQSSLATGSQLRIPD